MKGNFVAKKSLNVIKISFGLRAHQRDDVILEKKFLSVERNTWIKKHATKIDEELNKKMGFKSKSTKSNDLILFPNREQCSTVIAV